MSVDDAKKIDSARQDTLRDAQKEKPRAPRPVETEFDRVLERGKMAQQLGPQKQQGAKTSTEDAIREAVRHQDRDQQGRRDEEQKKEGRDKGDRSDRSETRATDGKVIAKGRTKQDGGGGGGGREGYGASSGKRELAKTLVRHGAKSVPVDLSSKFSGRLAKAMDAVRSQSPALTQQVLNKIVQFVRVGINRKGEKEIQVELSDRIFRGLKLRVIARGGKIAVHFKTSDPNGRKAFEENREAIEDALAKKGIEVDEIVIS